MRIKCFYVSPYSLCLSKAKAVGLGKEKAISLCMDCELCIPVSCFYFEKNIFASHFLNQLLLFHPQ